MIKEETIIARDSPKRKIRTTVALTVYAQAWEQYKATDEYKRAAMVMGMGGMKQPYINNILDAAFAAGFRVNMK